MSSSPFGLVMTLVAPLIAQFVNMDKITALVRKGRRVRVKHIGAAVGSLKSAGPLLKGLGNAMLDPVDRPRHGAERLIGALNRVHISIPDWVPKFGGRGFSFPVA
jgi:hypothetical protein